MRVKMVVAYDGTNYSGWQIQPNGVTIEQKLNEALQALLGEDIRVTGASRTDAGVHSLGNVCIFDTDTRMPAEKISYALNQRLPEDIVVQDSCEVPDTFHPRFSRSRKTYEYRILNRRFRMPTRRLDTYFYHYPLDVEKMQEAADYLVGEHDFKSFCDNKRMKKSTIRRISDIQINNSDGIITIDFYGNGFLYHMVRILTGTLLMVGTHELSCDDIPDIIEKKSRDAAGFTAPPQGLCLVEVDY